MTVLVKLQLSIALSRVFESDATAFLHNLVWFQTKVNMCLLM